MPGREAWTGAFLVAVFAYRPRLRRWRVGEEQRPSAGRQTRSPMPQALPSPPVLIGHPPDRRPANWRERRAKYLLYGASP